MMQSLYSGVGGGWSLRHTISLCSGVGGGWSLRHTILCSGVGGGWSLRHTGTILCSGVGGGWSLRHTGTILCSGVGGGWSLRHTILAHLVRKAAKRACRCLAGSKWQSSAIFHTMGQNLMVNWRTMRSCYVILNSPSLTQHGTLTQPINLTLFFFLLFCGCRIIRRSSPSMCREQICFMCAHLPTIQHCQSQQGPIQVGLTVEHVVCLITSCPLSPMVSMLTFLCVTMLAHSHEACHWIDVVHLFRPLRRLVQSNVPCTTTPWCWNGKWLKTTLKNTCDVICSQFSRLLYMPVVLRTFFACHSDSSLVVEGSLVRFFFFFCQMVYNCCDSCCSKNKRAGHQVSLSKKWHWRRAGHHVSLSKKWHWRRAGHHVSLSKKWHWRRSKVVQKLLKCTTWEDYYIVKCTTFESCPGKSNRRPCCSQRQSAQRLPARTHEQEIQLPEELLHLQHRGIF